MLIVETIDERHFRMPAGGRNRVTALNEVAIYTEGDDKPLMEVFENIRQFTGGKPVDFDPRHATPEQLAQFMTSVLPDYDRDRVHQSDIKKLIQWYNILVNNGLTDFVEPDAAPAAEAETPAAQ